MRTRTTTRTEGGPVSHSHASRTPIRVYPGGTAHSEGSLLLRELLIQAARRLELHSDVVSLRVHTVAAIQVRFEPVNPGKKVFRVGLRVEFAACEFDVNRVRVRLLRADGKVRHRRAAHTR